MDGRTIIDVDVMRFRQLERRFGTEAATAEVDRTWRSGGICDCWRWSDSNQTKLLGVQRGELIYAQLTVDGMY